MGESIYKFSLREIPGAFLRAWNLEKVRLERVGKGVWSLDNEIIPPLMITLAVYTALVLALGPNPKLLVRSEEHTSELQSLMRISYAVFCLKKKIKNYIDN